MSTLQKMPSLEDKRTSKIEYKSAKKYGKTKEKGTPSSEKELIPEQRKKNKTIQSMRRNGKI